MGDKNEENEWSSDRSKEMKKKSGVVTDQKIAPPKHMKRKTQSPTHEKPIRKECIEGPNQTDKPKEEKEQRNKRLKDRIPEKHEKPI